MKRITCLSYGFVKTQFVYRDASKVELPPIPAAAPEKKFLFETLEEAREVLKTAEKKLREVEAYYKIGVKVAGRTVTITEKERKMPDNVRKAYIAFYQKYIDLWAQVDRSKEAQKKIALSEQDVIEKTLAEIDEKFAVLKAEHEKAEALLKAKHKGDPLRAQLESLRFPETTLRPPPKPKKKEEGKPEKTAAKFAPKEYGKTPFHLLFKRAQSVIGKILNNFETNVSEPMTAEEQSAIMILMNPGSSRKVKYGDREYTLECDKSGRFVRIRDYRRTEGAGAEEEFFNPSIAFSGTSKNKKPLWPMTSKLDIIQAKVEKNQNEFKKQLEWLKSAQAAPGSVVTFWEGSQYEKPDEDGTEKLLRFQFDAAKQADGSFRVTMTERVFRRNLAKKWILPDEEIPEKKNELVFASAEDVVKTAGEYMTVKSSVSAEKATPQQQEAEMKLAKAKNLQELKKAAESLADWYIAVHILGPEHEPKFQEALDKVVKLLQATKKTEWFFKSARVPFKMKVKDNELAILEDNPDFKKMEGVEKYVVARSVPLKYEAPEGVKKVV